MRRIVLLAVLVSSVALSWTLSPRGADAVIPDAEVNTIGDDPNDCSVGLNEANQAVCQDGAQ